MKMKKILSIFLVFIFAGCLGITAFAMENPPQQIFTDGGANSFFNNNISISGSGDTFVGGPLDSVTTGSDFYPPVAPEASVAPEITKHPGSEEKKTGESTSFIARAYPYDTVAWMAIDPASGEHVAVDSIGDKIKGVTFTGTHS